MTDFGTSLAEIGGALLAAGFFVLCLSVFVTSTIEAFKR